MAITAATRRELTDAVIGRYQEASVSERSRILDEFVALTGFHRKHAIRVLNAKSDQRHWAPATLRSSSWLMSPRSNARERTLGAVNAEPMATVSPEDHDVSSVHSYGAVGDKSQAFLKRATIAIPTDGARVPP